MSNTTQFPRKSRTEVVLDKMQEMWEHNPVGFVLAIGSVFAGVSKVVNSVANYRSQTAYAKDVNRRLRNSNR